MKEQPMPLIQFKTFGSSEEFVKWQQDEKPQVYGITPVVVKTGVGLEVKGEGWTADQIPVMGVFVTFSLPIEPMPFGV